jgi:hypothetical protein
MKKTFKLLAILALLAAIGFSFIACSMEPASEPDAPPKPFDEVKAEIKVFDGSTLEFSEKPVRAQWGIGDSPYDIAFVFPLNTMIRQRLNGALVQIKAVSEYRAKNRIFPIKDYGNYAYELTLTREIGKETYGVRIVSANMDRGLLTVLIDGLTELAVNPGNSIIHASDIDPSKPKPADEKTLAGLRLPSRDIQSDAREIAALAKTTTDSKTGDYEKAKAIHQWAAGNIWYNYDWLNGSGDKNAEWREGEETWSSTFVLRNKRGICGVMPT